MVVVLFYVVTTQTLRVEEADFTSTKFVKNEN
jgi:hypothetical protein